jgi:hypothetical protein
MDLNFVPVDKVVDLAASLRSTTVVAGAIACAVTLYILKRSVPWTLVACMFGGMVGYGIGLGLAPVMFSALTGLVAVVKLDTDAIVDLLKTNAIGGVTSGVLVAAVPAWLFAQAVKSILLILLGGGIGLAVGLGLGYLAFQS